MQFGMRSFRLEPLKQVEREIISRDGGGQFRRAMLNPAAMRRDNCHGRSSIQNQEIVVNALRLLGCQVSESHVLAFSGLPQNAWRLIHR